MKDGNKPQINKDVQEQNLQPQQELERLLNIPISSGQAPEIQLINNLLGANPKYKFDLNVQIREIPALFILLNYAWKNTRICPNLRNVILEQPIEKFDWNKKVDAGVYHNQTSLYQLIQIKNDFTKIVLERIFASDLKLDWKVNHSILVTLCKRPDLFIIALSSCRSKSELDNLVLYQESPVLVIKELISGKKMDWVYALLLIYPTSMAAVVDNSILEFKKLYEEISRNYWHYSSSTEYTHGNYNSDALRLVLHRMLEANFSVHLANLLPKDREWILGFAINNFQGYQPTEADLQIEFESNKALGQNIIKINKEILEGTSKLAVAEYRMQQPAEKIAHFPIGRFNRLHTDIVSSVVSQLLKSKVIPCTLTAFHRSKIIQSVSEIKDPFTKNTVFDKLNSTFSKKNK